MAQEATEKAKPDLEEFAELGDELEKYVGTLKLEKETKKQISRFVSDVGAALSKPVELDAGHLSKWFPRADSAVLLDGEKLVVRHDKGETAFSLLKLKPDPYFAVVKEVAAVVARLMAEEDARRAEGIRPVLQVFTRLIGGKLAVFDWRNYMLVFANTGGAAKDVEISMSTAGDEWYGPFDISAMETKEVAMRHFYRILNSKVLKIALRCEDEEGRKYAGEVELRPNSNTIRVFRLTMADAAPR